MTIFLATGNNSQNTFNWMQMFLSSCNDPNVQISELVPGNRDDSQIIKSLNLNVMFYRRSYYWLGTNSALIGAYYGICFDIMYLGSTPQNIYSNVKKHKYKKFLARFCILYVVYFLLYAKPIDSIRYYFDSANSYVYSSLLSSQISYFIFWFLTFGLSKSIFAKFNLINLS